MKRGRKYLTATILIFSIFLILSMPIVSAGLGDWFKNLFNPEDKTVYSPNNPPEVVSIISSENFFEVNKEDTFWVSYSDRDGAEDLKYAYLIINTDMQNTPHKVWIEYRPSTNKFGLVSDAGSTDGVMSYYCTPGSNEVIQNSYVKLNCETSTASGSGYILKLNLALTFKQPFIGDYNMYLYAKDNAGARTEWVDEGDLSVVEESTQEPYCTDSDGGKDYYVKGEVKVDSDINQDINQDICWTGGNTLHEYWCQEGEQEMTAYDCPYGCQDGACLKNPNIIKINDGEEIMAKGHTISVIVEDTNTASITINGVTMSKDETWSGEIGDVNIHIINIAGSTVAGVPRFVELEIIANPNIIKINDREEIIAEGHTISIVIEDVDTASITIDGVTYSKDEGWSGNIGNLKIHILNIVDSAVAGVQNFVELELETITCNQDSDCPEPTKGELYCGNNNQLHSDLTRYYCDGRTCINYTSDEHASHCPEGCTNNKCNGEFKIEKIELVDAFQEEESKSVLIVETPRDAVCSYSTDNINFNQFDKTNNQNHFQSFYFNDRTQKTLTIKCTSFDNIEFTQTYQPDRTPYQGETCNELTNFLLRTPKSFIFENSLWELNYNHSWAGLENSNGENYPIVNYYSSYRLNDYLNDYNGYISFSLEAYELESEELKTNLKEELNQMLRRQICSPREFGNEEEIYYVCKNLYNLNLDDKDNDYENAQIIWISGNKLFNLNYNAQRYDNNYYNYDEDQLDQIQNELYEIQREIQNLNKQGENIINIISKIKDNQRENIYVYDNMPWRLEEFVKDVLFKECSSNLLNDETICSPWWQCNIEPAICPPHGQQTKTCIDTRECFEKVTETQSCSPGICSGCYVPRWFEHDGLKQNTLNNICMPYGTRFRTENGWTMKEVAYEHSDKEGLTIEEAKENRGVDLTVFENNTALLYWDEINKTLYLEEGMSIDLNLIFEESENYENILDVIKIKYASENYDSSYIEVVIKRKGTHTQKVPDYLNMYCNYNGQIMNQKTIDKQGNWANCQNNYECESNACSSGECIEITTMIQNAKGWKNLLSKIACKFGHLFNIENYQQCVADRIGGSKSPSSMGGSGGGSANAGPPSM